VDHCNNLNWATSMINPRPDISPSIAHYTKGDTWAAAFENLLRIIRDGSITDNSFKIKGDYRCVCFSEAPLGVIGDGLANSAGYRRYSPFGIMFEKRHIFELGGRPVIYQSDDEFNLLLDDQKWRHMRYEPNAPLPVDFTWEREWRIRRDQLQFTAGEAIVVVPDRRYAEQLQRAHNIQQDWQVLQYSLVLGEDTAELYRQDFPWRMTILNE